MSEVLKSTYTVGLSIQPVWRVGYSFTTDELFVWRYDNDGLCWFFRGGGLDLICFDNHVLWDKFVDLGEL